MRRVQAIVLGLALFGCGESDSNEECTPEDCTAPPPSICVTDSQGSVTDVLVTYLEQGTCVQDRCAYQATQATCPGNCLPEFDENDEPVSAQCVTEPPG